MVLHVPRSRCWRCVQPKHYHCVEIHQSVVQFGYILHEIGNRVCGGRWTCPCCEQNVTAKSVLTPGFVELQKFMFSDRYHLAVSTLARVCPSMTCLMLRITSFNCCRTSLLLLLLNVFLKVRAVYFKADSTISSAFQCSAC